MLVVIGEDIDYLFWKVDCCDVWCDGDCWIVLEWVILSEWFFDKYI